MDTVKVSGFATASQHAKLSAATSRRKTTVTAFVTFAVGYALKAVEEQPDLWDKIKGDKRRQNGVK